MQILIVNFQLNGMSHEEIAHEAAKYGPVFGKDIPGLHEKVFLSDPETGTYGGVYKFEDRASLDAYLAGEIWTMVQTDPTYANVTAKIFGVFEEPTRAAHGYPAAAAVA